MSSDRPQPLDCFPFYYSRFLNSRRTRRLDAEGAGIFMLLLIDQWENGPIPDDDGELAFVGRCEAQDARHVLSECFTLTAGGWLNERLEEVREEQIAKHERRAAAGRASGEARRRAKDKAA